MSNGKERSIVLLRHSITAGNLVGRYIGTTDESLCPEGIQLLKMKKMPEAELVYTSPMKRCKETAALLWPGISQKIIESLRECDFGEFENKNYKELNGNPKYQAWVDSCGALPFPGGESQEQFRLRCRNGFLEAVKDMKEKDIETAAMVCHGGTIMSILEPWGLPKKDFYGWQVKNAEGFFIRLPGDWKPGKAFPTAPL